VIAVGAGAALLSSLLTAGTVSVLRGDDTGTTSSAATLTGSSTATTPGPVHTAADGTPDWVAVAAQVEPSVVSVRVSGQSGSGEGSGIVLDTAGHILTNNHVVAEASGGGRIAVVLSDGRAFGASVIGTDPATDLAVLKLAPVPSGLVAATFGDSNAVQVGEAVMAIGNPLGLSDTVTTGIVSAVNRPVTTTTSIQNQNPFAGSASGETVVTNAIQTDAAINPGNSGGALVNSTGQVIGITSSIASLGSSMGGQSGSIGLGFAIPASTARQIASEIIANKPIEHAYLGVTLRDGQVSLDGAKRQAAVIGSVSPGTAAAKAGLTSKDAIIAFDGDPLDGSESLVARIRDVRPGTTVKLTVVRAGKAIDVDVTLGVRPTG
jgi:putative serine protease PepD